MREARHAAILDLIRGRRVRSQEELRSLLYKRGFEVTQATLSRDLRDLGVGKVPDSSGRTHYVPASDLAQDSTTLKRLLPHLMTGAEGIGVLVVLKTIPGGAKAVAEAIDGEGWPQLMGSLAGDDTILLILRREGDRETLVTRLRELAAQ